jgi:Tfp pilus assembly PilM family ATPase
LIDLGHAGTSVTIATDGMVRLHRYVPVGGRHLTLHLAEKQQLDEAAASKLKTQLTSLDPLVEPLEQLAVRVERVFQHFEDLNPCEKIDHIRICGGTAALAGLPEFFSEFFQERVERLNPFEQLGLGPEHPSAETLRVSAWAFAACWGLVA